MENINGLQTMCVKITHSAEVKMWGNKGTETEDNEMF